MRELVDASRGRYVLGNHEIRLIATALGAREMSPLDSTRDVLDAPDAADWIAWLRERPLAVESQIGAQPFVMLHASAHPEWTRAELSSQARAVEARLRGDDEELRDWLREGNDVEHDALGRFTRCRSVGERGAWSSDPPANGQVPWHLQWASRTPDFGVVYGHWALQGLHIAPMLRGLDTGCVHHGRGRDGMLTAWLPDPACETPFAVPDDHFWQIPARRAYYAHRDKHSSL